jgi:2-amino-4-hydroxy-6-hydroxymethyldihydropteridine diphosphokinase
VPVSTLPHTACIGLGSNLGDSLALLARAWQRLDAHPRVAAAALSSPYRTAPVDMDSSNWFVNAAGLLHTSLSPLELLAFLQEVENEFGRIRRPGSTGHQDRTLDLDLLLFDDRILDTPVLTLPHPAMHQRGFVLVPLAEIAPGCRHPRLQSSVVDLLARLRTSGGVTGITAAQWAPGDA